MTIQWKNQIQILTAPQMQTAVKLAQMLVPMLLFVLVGTVMKAQSAQVNAALSQTKAGPELVLGRVLAQSELALKPRSKPQTKTLLKSIPPGAVTFFTKLH